MKYSLTLSLVMATAFFGAGASYAQQVCPLTGQPISTVSGKTATADKTIVETAVGAEDLTTLVAAVKQGELVETLSGKGPFTVFAPINSAFAKLPKETIESLLMDENRSDLQAILTYHVVAGKVMAADVVKLKSAKSVQGSPIKITVKDGKVFVNEAQVIKTDIVCSNGVVHLIDSVILPPALPSIVEAAIGNEDFSTLVTLVKHAGLVETLSGEGPFTVFAPSNAAFAKLPKETVDALLSDAGKDQLASILKYHVVPGKVMSADAVKLKEAKTALGQSAKISVRDGKAFIDGAQIVTTDIECSNGVIHVIDSVILPQDK